MVKYQRTIRDVECDKKLTGGTVPTTKMMPEPFYEEMKAHAFISS
jgi:hypothetical protein